MIRTVLEDTHARLFATRPSCGERGDGIRYGRGAGGGELLAWRPRLRCTGDVHRAIYVSINNSLQHTKEGKAEEHYQSMIVIFAQGGTHTTQKLFQKGTA